MAVAEAKAIAPSRRWELGVVLRDCVLAALVAAVLFIPILGVRTEWIGGANITLRYRWPAVIIACAVVFVGRLLFQLLIWNRSTAIAPIFAPLSRPLANLELGKYLGPVVLLCALVLPFMPFSDRYVMDVSILIATYVMLGWGLQVVVGLAGLLDLGYVAFYAVGA
jgi:branched-chain amino acid transport system permease protein